MISEIKNILYICEMIEKLEYLKYERLNCYWFWEKGKYTKTRIKGRLKDYTIVGLNGYGEWNKSFKKSFYIIFDRLIDRYMKEKYNGQTKSEYEKNYKRVRDIVEKSGGNVTKMVSLSQSQAAKIMDEWKAINRAIVAKELGYEDIFEVFFNRAYQLGTVSTQELREYKLEKLGL